jgi:putative hydrolase of the HAD superfamily
VFEVLSFDLDDTLWDVEVVIKRAEQKLLDWLAENYPAMAAGHNEESLRRHSISSWKRWPELAHDMSELRRRSLVVLAEECGYPGFDPNPAFEHFYQWRNTVELLPGVAEALDQLSENHRLIALSNGNANIQDSGLDKWFEFGLAADNVGHAKPHPAIFEQACKQAGCLPRQVLHIGDDLRSDVLGAQQAGMKTALVTAIQRNQYPDLKITPDYCFDSVPELARFFTD